MRVALADIDGTRGWPNLALMKLSAWHKAHGHEVEWFLPLMAHTYDRVYASKVFTFSKEPEDLPEDTIRGGTGYGTPSTLPCPNSIPWLTLRPDYSLYPEYERDIGFITRGCIRKCDWCVVPKYEGTIKRVATFEDIWTGRPSICFLDNSILALMKAFEDTVEKARRHEVEISFNQGLDIRLLDDDSARLLAAMPTYEALHFGFDDLAYADAFQAGCQLLRRHEIIGRTVFLFLVGFNTTVAEEIERLKIAVKEKAGVYFMFYDRGRNIHGPFGDVDFLLEPKNEAIIRAPTGNLRKYRRLVDAAWSKKGMWS
jgi:hypothetical protein